MPRIKLLDRLWRLFSKPVKESPIVGSQYPLGVGTAMRVRNNLDIPELPIRHIIDYATTRELIEMRYWSFEARNGISFLSHDCFQQQNGSSGSWGIKEGAHPDIISISQELAARNYGKELIIGGDKLQRAARDMLFFGDAFLELGFEKDGLGAWNISRSCYLPALSIFVNEAQDGRVNGYSQQQGINKTDNDVDIHPIKILHFSYEKNTRYGLPLVLQNVMAWDAVKDAGSALSKAAMECGVAPWVHLLPPGQDAKAVKAYRDRHQQSLMEGPITNLYLMSGSEIKKAAADSNAIKPLADYFLACRRRMIPPGVPAWMYPDLGQEARANDLAGQPAMAYGRTVSNLRSILGNQIKWAVSLEICLVKGFDWFVENGRFEIVWGDWIATPGQAMMQNVNDS